MNSSIFKDYDIRGVYGRDFDDRFAFDLGNKVGQHFSADSSPDKNVVIVGKDGRPSSNAIGERVIEGLLKSGAHVVSLGECSTPLFYFVVKKFGASGGIMVTASHNQSEYNGFKIVGRESKLISGGELKELFEFYPLQMLEGGDYEERDFTTEYADAVIKVADFDNADKRLNGDIIYKASPGVGRILRALESKANFNFKEAAATIDQEDSLKIKYDDDGDRLAFENADSSAIFCIVADAVLPKKIVFGMTASRAARKYARSKGFEVIMAKVGHSNIHHMMQGCGADLGIEASGHIYFKSFNFLEAPELALLIVLKQIIDSGRRLEDLAAQYPVFPRAEKTIDSSQIHEKIIQRIGEKFSDGEADFTDGLTVEYPDWWFNVRASNTEPVLRLTVEAETKKLLDDKFSELTAVLG